MKYILKYSKFLFACGLVLFISGCSKNKFLNVNANPNDPATVPVNLVLPTCEANIGYMVGNTLAIYGGLWSQYWTQDPTYGSQYGSFDSYLNLPTDNDNAWQALYTTATNLNFIIASADTTQRNYRAIAYFMKAYDFQLICDGWGDVPLSQALKGTANLAPAFDPGQQVYDSIASWVYTGISSIDPNRNSPPEDLIYPGAPMAQWQKFANTLLMKIYLRECLKNPSRAATGFQKLTAEMQANGSAFMSQPANPAPSQVSGDDAMLFYQAVTFQQFPLYATQVYLQVQNLTASATLINYMNTLTDPRVKDFYSPDAATGGYGGEIQGDYKALNGQPDVNFSPVGPEIISPTASTRLLTAAESDFLQAEAIVRTYLTTGSASVLYTAGVTASFAEWDSSSAAGVGAYLAQGSVSFGSATGQQALQLILTQKWLAMCGNQNFEAWTEWRRTRYPAFFTPSVSSQIPSGKWPRRLVYPAAELNNNTNFPGEQAIYQPVWWDINP